MYKLLLATDQPDVLALFGQMTDWDKLGFLPPVVKTTAQEAIDYMESNTVDTVGYSFSKRQAIKINRYMRDYRPSLPIFQVRHHIETQQQVLRDARGVLDQLHADFADGAYDEQAMLDIMRMEFSKHMLMGEITDVNVMENHLHLMRARVSTTKPCMLFEIDMPQGEVYLTDCWHYGTERLESALNNNFFRRYIDGIYYAVAVMTPRRIRVAACQIEDDQAEDDASFTARAAEYVHDTISRVKEFLDLDMTIEQEVLLDSIKAFIRES